MSESVSVPWIEYKVCTKCSILRPITEFNKDKQNKRDGLASHCKTCTRANSKQWDIKNRELKLERSKERYKNNPEYFKSWLENNKENNKEYLKQWHNKNPNYNKVWYENNPEYLTEWNKNNPDKQVGYSRAWRENNPEESKEVVKKYRRTPKGKTAVLRANHNRRIQLKETVCDLTADQIQKQIKDQDNCCAYCGVKFTKETPAHIHHITPLKLKGSLTFGSILAVHMRCNSKLGAKLDMGRLNNWFFVFKQHSE